MAEQTLEVVELTIKWHMVPDDDNLIKFEGRDNPYEMTDAVKEFIKSKDISQTAKVKVSINPEGGEDKNGLVERIEVLDDKASEVKSEPEKEEAVQGDKSEVKGCTKELTLGGVSVEKKNVIFKEEENVWYVLADSIDAQKVKDEMTHKTVKVDVRTTGGDEKDVIETITVVGTPQNNYDRNESKAENSSVQSSIEAQVSVEHANLIVSKTIDKDSDPETIKVRITTLAEHNYKTIQDLKKK